MGCVVLIAVSPLSPVLEPQSPQPRSAEASHSKSSSHELQMLLCAAIKRLPKLHSLTLRNCILNNRALTAATQEILIDSIPARTRITFRTDNLSH